ncbi:hypothetical protein NQZ68_031710 [Dissostichus eleginoides]|nr:hypothetical protein NQZ68_031710 [Dissostichus eleginoides]
MSSQTVRECGSPCLQGHTVLDRRPLVTTTKDKHNDKPTCNPENTSSHAALASAAVIQCRQFVVASSPRGNHDNRKKPKVNPRERGEAGESSLALQSCISGQIAKLKEP